MTDITINATAGGLITSSNATYLTARSGSNLSANSGANSGGIGQEETGGTYTVREGFLEFDLSSLSGLTPTAAVIRIDANATGLPAPNMSLTAYERDWGGGTLTTADYVPGASLGGLTVLAELNSDDADGSYVDMTSVGGALLAAIGGATLRICLATDEETNASAPPSGQSRYFDCGILQVGSQVQLVVTVPGSGYPQVRVF